MTYDDWRVIILSGTLTEKSLADMLTDWERDRNTFIEKIKFLGCIEYDEYRATHAWIDGSIMGG